MKLFVLLFLVTYGLGCSKVINASLRGEASGKDVEGLVQNEVMWKAQEGHPRALEDYYGYDLSFSLITMPLGDDGLQQTVMSDQVATSLVGGPAILFGAVPTDVVLQICDKIVSEGQFTFSTEIFMEGYVDGSIHPVLNLQATGGCGNPLAPAYIQTKFDSSSGHTFGIVCAEDAQATGLCPIWMYGTDVSGLWESMQVRRLHKSEKRFLLDEEASAANSPRRLDCELQAAGAVVAAGGVFAGCILSLGMGCPFAVVGLGISLSSTTKCAVESSGGCFPGDTVVYKPSGRALISEIKVGDSVATTVNENGQMQFETVYFLGHDDAKAYTKFYHIEAIPLSENLGIKVNSTTAAVEMTAFHFIPVLSASKKWVNTRAKDIGIGDIILASSQDNRLQMAMSLHIVSQVTVLKKYGLFNPYTMNGRILVNNVSVSVHSEWVLDPIFDALGLTSWLPQVYQILLSPLRVLVCLLGVELYAKTYIASSLTQAISSGRDVQEEVGLPTLNTFLIVVSVPVSLWVAVYFLQKKKNIEMT